MNITVDWEGTDITNKLESFTIEEGICDSFCNLSFTIASNSGYNIGLEDVIIVYIDGIQFGKYWVSKTSNDIGQNVTTVSAGSANFKLTSYFISSKYVIEDFPYATTKYWIEKFLTEAGVSYVIDSDSAGEFLPDDEVLGMSMASEQIMKLLQYSGWYMRFDTDGVAIIGTLDYDSDYYSNSFDDTEILKLNIYKDDEGIRNRVVVWGMGSKTSKSWIFADARTYTPWDIDSKDIRTAVLANSHIVDTGAAYTIAKKALNVFSRVLYKKDVEIAGAQTVHLGDRVYIDSKEYSAICTVTSVNISASNDGLTTKLTLDERCPRLIGYLNFGGYVYAGTNSEGIWRKPLKLNHTWYDYSTGLSSKDISDLSIASGNFACIASGVLNIRKPGYSQWVPYHPTFTDVDGIIYTESDVSCMGCVVDRGNGDIFAGYTTKTAFFYDDNELIRGSGTKFRSWVSRIRNGTAYAQNTQVTMSGIQDFAVIDIDNNGYDTYVNTYAIVPSSVLQNTLYSDDSIINYLPSGIAPEDFTIIDQPAVNPIMGYYARSQQVDSFTFGLDFGDAGTDCIVKRYDFMTGDILSREVDKAESHTIYDIIPITNSICAMLEMTTVATDTYVFTVNKFNIKTGANVKYSYAVPAGYKLESAPYFATTFKSGYDTILTVVVNLETIFDEYRYADRNAILFINTHNFLESRWFFPDYDEPIQTYSHDYQPPEHDDPDYVDQVTTCKYVYPLGDGKVYTYYTMVEHHVAQYFSTLRYTKYLYKLCVIDYETGSSYDYDVTDCIKYTAWDRPGGAYTVGTLNDLYMAIGDLKTQDVYFTIYSTRHIAQKLTQYGESTVYTGTSGNLLEFANNKDFVYIIEYTTDSETGDVTAIDIYEHDGTHIDSIPLGSDKISSDTRVFHQVDDLDGSFYVCFNKYINDGELDSDYWAEVRRFYANDADTILLYSGAVAWINTGMPTYRNPLNTSVALFDRVIQLRGNHNTIDDRFIFPNDTFYNTTVLSNPSNTLKLNADNSFTVMFENMGMYKLETSQQLPIVYLPNKGATVQTFISPDMTRPVVVNTGYYSENPPLDGVASVIDSRSFSCIASGIYMENTLLTLNMADEAGNSTIKKINLYTNNMGTYLLGATEDWITMSGVATYLETSNEGYYPYIFVATSGGNFYQKDVMTDSNSTVTSFVDCTSNFPDTEITVIRVDDII